MKIRHHIWIHLWENENYIRNVQQHKSNIKYIGRFEWQFILWYVEHPMVWQKCRQGLEKRQVWEPCLLNTLLFIHLVNCSPVFDTLHTWYSLCAYSEKKNYFTPKINHKKETHICYCNDPGQISNELYFYNIYFNE